MAHISRKIPLNLEEINQLCSACQDTLDKLVVWTLLDTGLRVSELCQLTPEHLDWSSNVIRLTSRSISHLDENKVRYIPLTKRIIPLLKHHFSIHPEWPIGIRQTQKIVKQVACKAGLSSSIAPSTLRYTFAACALKQGISLSSIQNILGHYSLSSTARYFRQQNIRFS